MDLINGLPLNSIVEGIVAWGAGQVAAFAAVIGVIGSRLSTILPVGLGWRALGVGVVDLLIGLGGAAPGDVVLLVILLGFLDAFLLAGLLFGGHGAHCVGGLRAR